MKLLSQLNKQLTQSGTRFALRASITLVVALSARFNPRQL